MAKVKKLVLSQEKGEELIKALSERFIHASINDVIALLTNSFMEVEVIDEPKKEVDAN